MSETLRLVVADDQPLVCAGFAAILARAGFAVLDQAADGEAAITAVRRHRPDIVLMDIRMPGTDGLAATQRIVADPANTTRVIVLTTFDLDRYVYAALAAGASGFLLKDVTPEQLIAAVHTVHSGVTLLAPAITTRLVERHLNADASRFDATALAALTAREREILTLIARGRSNTDICAELFISEATVKTHVSAIFAKLDLKTRAQAVVAAYETGLVAPASS
jgi:DNA-binding NarL/FixJ family response regulator